MSIYERMENYKSPFEQAKETTDTNKQEDVLNHQDRYIQQIKEEGFHIEKIEPILKTQGTQLVISGAGSGKTTVLSFQVQNDIITREATKLIQMPNSPEPVRVVDNILVCTFLKTGVEDLKKRLTYWQRKMSYTDTVNSIHFKTIHKEFIDVLKSIGCPMNIIDFDKMRRITKDTCEKYRISNKSSGYMSNEDYKIIEGIFTYCRNWLDNTKYNHPEFDTYSLTPTIIDSMLYDMKESRRKLNVVDFEDSQEIMYQTLKSNTAFQDLVASRYSIIYIDEFQDTSQIQYAILKYYFKGAKKVVAFGDDDQTIYTWRGSDINIITKDFIQDYKPAIQKLDINFRCPSNILEPIIPSIMKNENRHYKELKSYIQGGILEIISDREVMGFAERMLESIIEDMRNERTVAILTRTNYDGLIPAFLIQLQRKFNYSISSEAMTANSALPRSILNLASLYTERTSLRVQQALDMITPKNGKYSTRKFYDAIKSTSNKNIWNVPINDIKHSAPLISDVIEMLRQVKEESGELMSFIRLLHYVKMTNFLGDSEYSKGARNFIDLLFIILSIREYSSVAEFMMHFRELNQEVGAHVKNTKGARVHIGTVHEAKGKEWDSVYIWNDVEGVFPSSKTGESVEDYEEERRVHYIAWTRAKEKLTVLTIAGSESPFLLECDIPREKINPSIKGALKQISKS